MAGKTKDDHIIVAIHVTDRLEQAALVQAVFTKYGKSIKTRLGLHEANGKTAAPNGIILLELVGSQRQSAGLIAALNAITGVEAKSIVFGH